MPCAFCGRSLPTSLLDAALYLRGDPGLCGPRICREHYPLLLLGLDLSAGHGEQLLDPGLIVDPVPLFERAAGRLTGHDEAWVRREWGESADV
jgi:hypothetical protein